VYINLWNPAETKIQLIFFLKLVQLGIKSFFLLKENFVDFNQR
jgi:hypothetical protein